MDTCLVIEEAECKKRHNAGRYEFVVAVEYNVAVFLVQICCPEEIVDRSFVIRDVFGR